MSQACGVSFSSLIDGFHNGRSSFVTLGKGGDSDKGDPVRQAALMAESFKPQVPTWGIEFNLLGSMVLEPKTGFEFPSLLSCKNQNSGASSQV